MRTASPAVTAAFHATEQAEQAVFGHLLDQPTAFHVRNRVAWSVDSLEAIDHTRLPDPIVRDLPAPNARTTTSSRSAIVRLGKRPAADNVRARSFLVDDGQALTLKATAVALAVPDMPGESRRELRVRQEVQQVAAYPAPAVLGAGTAGDVDYLLEPVVFGTMPSTPRERLTAAVDVIGRLADAYLAAGMEDRRLDAVLRDDFSESFRATVTAPWALWPSSSDQAAVISGVFRLVERNLSLPCSLGHGDMNMSNVIRDPHGRHWLVDWERGGRLPVAFDVRKLMLTSQAPRTVNQRLAGALRPFAGRGLRRYRWEHQLALGVCNEIAAAPRQRPGAARAGRLDQFDAKLAARLAWVAELLD